MSHKSKTEYEKNPIRCPGYKCREIVPYDRYARDWAYHSKECGERTLAKEAADTEAFYHARPDPPPCRDCGKPLSRRLYYDRHTVTCCAGEFQSK